VKCHQACAATDLQETLARGDLHVLQEKERVVAGSIDLRGFRNVEAGVQFHADDKRRTRLKVLLEESHHGSMHELAVIAVVIILAGIALSAWRKFYYSIIASISCVLVYALQQMTYERTGDYEEYMAFASHDLTNLGNVYTVLTSMFAHDPSYLGHLLINVLVLVMIGLVFEQRIGTRPFIVLYLLPGIGTIRAPPSSAPLGRSAGSSVGSRGSIQTRRWSWCLCSFRSESYT
jgi:membrane associated rhomboid family serine protease